MYCDMPKGYRRDGTTFGGKNSTKQARAASGAPGRYGPGELAAQPELIAEILRLTQQEGWSAQRVADHLQEADPRVTKRTVYDVTRRAREALKKAAQRPRVHLPGTAQVNGVTTPTVPGPAGLQFLPVPPGAVVELPEGRPVVPTLEPVETTLERTRMYLQNRVPGAMALCDTVLNKASHIAKTSGRIEDVDVGLRAAGRAVDLVRKLAGVDAAAAPAAGHRHLHFHGPAANPFG